MAKSSRRWLQDHLRDGFVKKAKRLGYRSRAVFKLEEIQKRDRVLSPGMTVVDLGAAPGGWSQYVSKIVGPEGRVIALDLLPIEPITPNVEILQGDFTEEETWWRLLQTVGDRRVDVVLSDMAPNLSGTKSVDQPRAIYLAELAFDAALRLLRPGGAFLVKLFQGEGFEDYQKQIRRFFSKVAFRKPKASRDRSREIYLLARDFGKPTALEAVKEFQP